MEISFSLCHTFYESEWKWHILIYWKTSIHRIFRITRTELYSTAGMLFQLSSTRLWKYYFRCAILSMYRNGNDKFLCIGKCQAVTISMLSLHYCLTAVLYDCRENGKASATVTSCLTSFHHIPMESGRAGILWIHLYFYFGRWSTSRNDGHPTSLFP